MQGLNGQQIITQFELQVGDITELSSAEELSLANRIYWRICRRLPWEFLKKGYAATVLSDANGSYITVPDNFAFFCTNNDYTNNSISSDIDAAGKVIFVGPSFTKYQIVNFSDRRQYRNQSGYAYLDLNAKQLRFTMPPVAGSAEFDYIAIPDALTLSTYPVFRFDFHEAIPYAMASENDVLQLSPKAKSYQQENQQISENIVTDMQYWNSNLQND